MFVARLKGNIEIKKFSKISVAWNGYLKSVDLLLYGTYKGLVTIKILWFGVGTVRTYQQ